MQSTKHEFQMKRLENRGCIDDFKFIYGMCRTCRSFKENSIDYHWSNGINFHLYAMREGAQGLRCVLPLPQIENNSGDAYLSRMRVRKTGILTRCLKMEYTRARPIIGSSIISRRYHTLKELSVSAIGVETLTAIGVWRHNMAEGSLKTIIFDR